MRSRTDDIALEHSPIYRVTKAKAIEHKNKTKSIIVLKPPFSTQLHLPHVLHCFTSSTTLITLMETQLCVRSQCKIIRSKDDTTIPLESLHYTVLSVVLAFSPAFYILPVHLYSLLLCLPQQLVQIPIQRGCVQRAEGRVRGQCGPHEQRRLERVRRL